MTADERSKMGEMLTDVHDQFITAVANGRANMTEDEVRAVATGMIYTGSQALDLKLVDEVGGLYEAKAKARQLGGLPADAPVEQLERPGGLFSELFGASQQSPVPGMDGLLGNLHPLLRLAGSMFLAPVDGSTVNY
jgi:protease-4